MSFLSCRKPHIEASKLHVFADGVGGAGVDGGVDGGRVVTDGVGGAGVDGGGGVTEEQDPGTKETSSIAMSPV